MDFTDLPVTDKVSYLLSNMKDKITDKNEAQAQRKRIYQEKKRNDKNYLIRSGSSFIRKFIQLLEENNASDDIQREYMSKVLHTIFFFGWIHKSQVKPEEFLSENHQDSLKNRFPQPFAQYKSHLPTQTPFSILLDYVTEEMGIADPDRLMNHLTAITADMYKFSADDNGQLTPSTFSFLATVIAYSSYQGPQDTENHNAFFGASLSCKGKAATLIMIDLSCIKTWHRAVASAVLSPEMGSAPVFSDTVSCQAYQIKGNYYIRKPPCEKCNEIFKNVTFDPPFNGPQNAVWNYGNCAETEALSKLLWHYPDAAIGELTNENRKIVEKRLIKNLRSNKFLVNTLEYFQAE